jgi:hypothetical protein
MNDNLFNNNNNVKTNYVHYTNQQQPTNNNNPYFNNPYPGTENYNYNYIPPQQVKLIFFNYNLTECLFKH